MKLWRDMTPEEKGALLLAYHEGKVIQFISFIGEQWRDCYGAGGPAWFNDCAYRVKPKPKPVVKEVVMHGQLEGSMWCFDSFYEEAMGDTHKITFNLVDGEPDCNSIKMVALGDQSKRQF